MRALVVFALVLLTPTSASSTQLLFSQVPADSSDAFAADRNQSCCPLADDFVLSSATIVTEFRWWGIYFREQVQDDDFEVSLYRDELVVGSTPLITFSAEASRTPTDLPGHIGFTIYEYSFQLPAPLDLDRGATYFFSVSNETENDFGFGVWFWQSAIADPFWFAAQNQFWRQDTRDKGLAFQVLGVPEPGTLAMLGGALGALGIHRRVRRLRRRFG